MMFDSIQTIRYMGNKSKLLNFIIPEIINVTNPGDTICDLMSGTNSIGYALKSRNRIFSNDIQQYSYVIGISLIKNKNVSINSKDAELDLASNFGANRRSKFFHYFEDVYSDTYFSKEQCVDIDSIRYSIEQIGDEYKRNLYLTALMGAMCKVQSTPGHFAQFMPKENDRIKILRNMNVWKHFLDKCSDFSQIVTTDFDNMIFQQDYHDLISSPSMNEVSCFYLDSPYSTEQYSRFYHVLETVVKYDSPEVSYQAKYRGDRFKSNFCYESKAESEFEKIIEFAHRNRSSLIISYSNKGVVSTNVIEKISRKYFRDVTVKTAEYKHSTQGKGSNSLVEYLFILRFDDDV